MIFLQCFINGHDGSGGDIYRLWGGQVPINCTVMAHHLTCHMTCHITDVCLQDGRCRRTEIGEKEMDSLFRECNFDYVLSCS